MSDVGHERESEPQDSTTEACCGNCAAYCAHEDDGYVHCLADQREHLEPDDSPCPEWKLMVPESVGNVVRLRIHTSSDVMEITMQMGIEEDLSFRVIVKSMLVTILLLVAMVLIASASTIALGVLLIILIMAGQLAYILRRRRQHER